MFKKSIVALCVAALAVIASPTAAMAAPIVQPSAASCSGTGDSYVNDRTVSSDNNVVEPGGSFMVDWSEGYFAPSAPVTIVVTGNSASDVTLTTGGVSTVGSTLDTAAGTNGALNVSVTVPADATGTYNVAATSTGACGGVSVEVVDTNDTDASGGVLGNNVSDDDSLAFTGGSFPLVLMTAAAGVLALGGILLTVRSRSRRGLQE